MDSATQLAVNEVVEKYNPHTVIVYGSRARGDATPDSDVDLACFVETSISFEDTRTHNGIFIDAWIYPTESMDNIAEFIKLGGSYCAVDKLGLGEKFLIKINEELQNSPVPLSNNEKNSIIELRNKILKQASIGDVEGNYRKSWLQQDLLQTYFVLRNLRFFGPKESFNWLKSNDLMAFELFSQSYEMPQDIEQLKRLAVFVLNI